MKLLRRKDKFIEVDKTDGGRRGIRTPGTVSGSAVFKTAALDHSAILPGELKYASRNNKMPIKLQDNP